MKKVLHKLTLMGVALLLSVGATNVLPVAATYATTDELLTAQTDAAQEPVIETLPETTETENAPLLEEVAPETAPVSAQPAAIQSVPIQQQEEVFAINQACVDADDAEYRHTYDLAAGMATVSLLSGMELCEGETQSFALLSYVAQSTNYRTSMPQTLFSQDIGTITSLQRSVDLQVAIPPCFYQVDLVWDASPIYLGATDPDGPERYGDRILGSNGGQGERSYGGRAADLFLNPTCGQPTALATIIPCTVNSGLTDQVQVVVTNTDDPSNTTITYDVTLGSQTQDITIADGQNGILIFSGLAAGLYSAAIVGDDGTAQTNQVNVRACERVVVPAAPTATFNASACVAGSTTRNVEVHVHNTDDDTNATVTYTVSLGGFAPQQVTIADGQTASVTFEAVWAATYLLDVMGSDGTAAQTHTVVVEECPPAGQVLGDSTSTPRSTVSPVLAAAATPAQIPATGSTSNSLGMIISLFAAALTYVVVLQQQRRQMHASK